MNQGDFELKSKQTMLSDFSHLRRPSTRLIIVLIAAILLLLAGGALAYTMVYRPYQIQMQATATARLQATAIQTALQDLYTETTSGTPIISDSLNTPDNYGWGHLRNQYGKCDFIDSTYRVRAAVGDYMACWARATNFTDFTYQVQVRILSGTAAGIVFRQTYDTNMLSYHFRITIAGRYILYKIVQSPNASLAAPLIRGSSPAIHRGLNQLNSVAVVARGNTFYLYVNQQYVTKVSDGTSKTGSIGACAESFGSSATEAAFSHAQVWQPQATSSAGVLQATSITAATQVALRDFYHQVTRGQPDFNDPLNAQDGNNWDEGESQGYSCRFANGVYESGTGPDKTGFGDFNYCMEAARVFDNLALQVEMNIVSGHSGGLIVRGAGNSSGYYFRISTDGIFLVRKVTSAGLGQGSSYTPLFAGYTTAVKTGNNQVNLMTVVAQGRALYMYINQQFVIKVNDDTYQLGKIAMFTDADASGALIQFRNMQAWKL